MLGLLLAPPLALLAALTAVQWACARRGWRRAILGSGAVLVLLLLASLVLVGIGCSAGATRFSCDGLSGSYLRVWTYFGVPVGVIGSVISTRHWLRRSRHS